MEFWQFHPTGVAGAGVLITEGVRGEGGILLNCNGERFMERYAPNLKDLASRDVVSRSMDQEIKEGRGCGPHKDYVLLKLDHLGPRSSTSGCRRSARSRSSSRTSTRSASRSRSCRRSTTRWAASRPTSTARSSRRRSGNPNAVVNGFYAIGECACVSVHGANRLGTNSLLDLLVFGRSAGDHIVSRNLKAESHKDLPRDAADRALARLARLDGATSGESVSEVAATLRKSMTTHCGVFRNEQLLSEGVKQVMEPRRAREARRDRRPQPHVQHRARRGARARQPDGDGEGDDRLGARAAREPRRAGAQRPPGARRRQLAQAHAVVLGRQPARLQAGQHEAADGRRVPAQGADLLTPMKFRIYRYDPEKDAKPYLKDYDVALDPHDRMLLDALVRLKAVDDTLSFRRSCREGVCGSDAMNINGKNGLACVTNLKTLSEPVVLKPLPGLPVIRDLIVDMSQFFKQYHSIKPYLVNDTPPPEKERLQSPEEREELDGLYECILCACCSTACPSFWWNPDKFVGPAGLLQAVPVHRGFARPRDQRAARQPRGPVPAVPLLLDHELRRRVPEGPQPDARDRADQGDHAEARV
jgi:succinate dehydrogenase / fumarate reductase iron-sulfur subunit